MRLHFVRHAAGLLLLGGMLAATHAATAQALVSANRGAEITPFLQTSIVSPDWGPTNNLGFTLGVDYTRFIRSIVQPSLEFRMVRSDGNTVGERAYTGGLKLQTSIHNIHPYMTFLVGHGNIDFMHPDGHYYGDNSVVYSLGGGADVPVSQHLRLKLDFTHQNWNLGPETLTPVTLSAGFAYTLPFHNRGVR